VALIRTDVSEDRILRVAAYTRAYNFALSPARTRAP
jgi:hypothetical protein